MSEDTLKAIKYIH